MKVTLEAEDMNMENPDLQEMVVQEAATQMLASLRVNVAEKVNKAIEARITEFAHSMVDKVLAAPLTRTDGYGQPKGEAKSIQETIVDSVVAYMGEKVDHSGSTDRYGGDKNTLRIVWASNVVAEKIIKEAQAKIYAEVKATVEAGLSGAITDAVRKILLPGIEK